MVQETADDDRTVLEHFEQYDKYEKPVTAIEKECESCGAAGYVSIRDPNHAHYHPDHASVVLAQLTSTFRSGGRKLVCSECL